ncbi:MAG: ParB N-terminal domain-containing protein [Candidatus Limivicinus sp.]|nr:ParB N-terminal domain-containing protein [Candidatus Limivicinus sp.]
MAKDPNSIQSIPIEKIQALPGTEQEQQPDKAYGSLVSSILINGVKEPVILRPMENGDYQLVSGYRRKRAAELAKLKELPAQVYDMTEKEALDYRARAAKDPKAPLPGQPVTEAEDKKQMPEETKTGDKSEAAKAPEKKAKKPAAKSKAAAPKEEVPSGPAATGPTGTAITRILESRLNPPTAKSKKDFPVPGEGEAFSILLHPAYLKKAEINTFSVDRDSDDFKELYKSIERFGVKDPVLARIGADGELEILSGQRRHLIATELNYPVPTIIQQLDNDDAGILVADGNLHREHISTYDLSRALKMKAEAMKRKAGRRGKGQSGPRLDTDEALAKEMGMNIAKLNRLIKLSEAARPICDLVDEGSLALSIAYNIAFLPPEAQGHVADLIGINVRVSNENTTVLKSLAKTEKLDYDKIRDVLEGRYPPPKVVEQPKPVEPVPLPSMAPTSIPKSPDVSAGAAPSTVIPVPPPMSEPKPVTTPAVPAPSASPEEKPDRENSYVTKVILTGDRLRKYFPDVSMTPRQIEDSVYDALEERRQRQEKARQKSEIFTR